MANPLGNPQNLIHLEPGPKHPRWSRDNIISSHGYTKVRVGREHPLGDPNGYAYEHLLVWVSSGRARPDAGFLLHHKNEDKGDNRLSNLEVLSKAKHAKKHQRMLSDELVRRLRERFAEGENGTDLATEFGVPASRAYRLIKGETRVAAGGPIATGCLRGKRRDIAGPEIRHA